MRRFIRRFPPALTIFVLAFFMQAFATVRFLPRTVRARAWHDLLLVLYVPPALAAATYRAESLEQAMEKFQRELAQLHGIVEERRRN